MPLAPDAGALRHAIRGTVLTAADTEFETARRVWNGMIDRRPALIVRCASADDVAAAVRFATDSGLRVAIRAGGHSFPGFSMCDDGLVIDVSGMKRLDVDPVTRRATAQAGLTWGEFDAATQAAGLACTGGMISHTGIAGLTLGGGFGWLARKHGMVVDNLVAADVVTADGRQVRASDTQNADLFWGLRGGGGNFGVVTSFEFRLHPLGPMLGGIVAYPLAEAPRVLRGHRAAMANAPDELTTTGLLLTTPDGNKAVGVALGYAGDDHAAGEAAIAPFRRLGTPVMEQIGPMPYVALQRIFDEAAVPGRRYYMRSNMLDDLDDAVIDTLSAWYAQVPSPLTAVLLVSMGGAISRVAEDATAYTHRGARYTMTALAGWTDAEDDQVNINWVRGLWDELAPSLPNRVYVNELHDEGPARVQAAYGPAYERLVALKRTFDPANVFRLNQNIRP